MKDNRVLPRPITQSQRVYYNVHRGGDNDHKAYPACIEKSARDAILALPSFSATRLIDYYFTYSADAGNPDRIKGMLESGKYYATMEGIDASIRTGTEMLHRPYFSHIMETGRIICEDELDDESSLEYLPLSRKSTNAWWHAGYRTAKAVLKFLDNKELWDESNKVQHPYRIGRMTLLADKKVIDRWRLKTAR